MAEWARWFRELVDRQFDKLCLVAIFIYMVQVVIHITHDNKDADLVLWARELAGTVAGGLLGLITGHALATRTTASTPSATITATTEPK